MLSILLSGFQSIGLCSFYLISLTSYCPASQNPGPSRYRWIGVIILALISPGPSIVAGTLELGLSLAEEGDDRNHPALTLQLNVKNKAMVRIHHYGLDLGAIRERNTVIGLGYLMPFMKYKTARCVLGVSYLQDEIFLPPEEFQGGSYRLERVGLLIGILWSPWKDLPVTLGWESHLYTAGSSSLLLTTARRQFIGLSGGFSW